MTKIIRDEMYCPKCKKNYVVPVVLSTNSFMLERDPMLMEKYKKGELFKNFCPVCKSELVGKKDK